MAYSPKAMVLPREAMPPRPPWVRFIILRCFIRFGCSMRPYSPVLGLCGGEGGVGGVGAGPVGGVGFRLAVVDIGPQRVQRHATPAVPLTTAHLGSAQPT